MKGDKRLAVYRRVTRGLRENGQEFFAAPDRREVVVALRGARVRTIHATMRVSDDASTLEVHCRLHVDGGARLRGVMVMAAAMANHFMHSDCASLLAWFSYAHVDREVTLTAQCPATPRALDTTGIAVLLRDLREVMDAFTPGFMWIAYNGRYPEEAMLRSRSGKPTPTRFNDPRIADYAPLFDGIDEEFEAEPDGSEAEACQEPPDVQPDEAPCSFAELLGTTPDASEDDEPAARGPLGTAQWIRNFRGEMTDHTQGLDEGAKEL